MLSVALTLPVLLSVAYTTVLERKQLGSLQRRLGPNTVGVLGLLQPFADAAKLTLKETVVPSHSNATLYYASPVITLTFSLLGWAVVPFGQSTELLCTELSVLYTLAVSSLGVYGVLYAGWSANSTYSFIGALRSTAQMLSYELPFSATVLCVVVLCSTLSYTSIVSAQLPVCTALALSPVFVTWGISSLAETNRTPFDLPEAESELVAGYFTEHSAMPFVLFFLAEYSSILLISTLTSLLWLSGYSSVWVNSVTSWLVPVYLSESMTLGFKTVLIVFMFVWSRATLPRLRYDQLMAFCWTGLLPVMVSALVLVPCVAHRAL